MNFAPQECDGALDLIVSPNVSSKAGSQTSGFAWLTPPANSALALLWVSEGMFHKLFRRFLTGVPTRLLWRQPDGQLIDEVLVWRGSGGCLLSLHGGPGTRAAAESALTGAGGCPQTVPDLWESRHALVAAALADLPHIQGALGAQLLLHCVQRGPEALAELEAMPPRQAQITRAAWAEAGHLYAPPRVQLWGPVNAGKSSLLNALCGESLAATGPEPGLTRDRIEGRCEQDGFVMRIFDAPGAGFAAQDVDRAAAAQAEALRRESELTLELVPPGASPTGAGDVVVFSRSDQDPQARTPAVSVNDAGQLAALKQTLAGHFIGRLLALPPGLRLALPRSWLGHLAPG